MDGVSAGRAKRQKIDKHGRMSALEKLKQLKGSKNKYEVDSLSNVYDVVDENEYSERVLQRQEEDWIDDDDGCGYVEDGREIFDDEEIAETQNVKEQKDNEGRAKKRKAKVSAFANSPSISEKGGIRSMFTNIPNKKKEDVKLSEDNVLCDIMSELVPKGSTEKPVIAKKPSLEEYSNGRSKREAQDYFKNLTKSNTKIDKKPVKIQETTKCSITQFESPVKEKPAIELKPNNVKIKVEKEEQPTQQIEEFNSQDLQFDGIDFNEDSMQDPIKVEPKDDAVIMDDLNADDFNDAAFTEPPIPPIVNKNVEKEECDLFEMPNLPTNNGDVDCNSLPLFNYEDGSKALRFYWWDAWEDRFVKPGVVFLFGKVYIDHKKPSKGCVSVCVTVKNVDRRLFLLPRENKLDPVSLEEEPDNPVSIEDVYHEFDSKVVSKLDIKEFRSRKVTKNYAFEIPDIPMQSEYLEVRYAATYPPPPEQKYETFSHIFGANTSYLEIFLLEKKIRGPCWLEISSPEIVSSKISWCKVEANCLEPRYLNVMRNENAPPPPLTIATIHMKTMIDPKTRLNMIKMLACLVTNSYDTQKPPPNPQFQQHFCIMTKCSNEIWPSDLKHVLSQFKGTKLTKCESERELLNYFLVQFWKIDPDIVLGHDLHDYQQDLLIGNIVNKNIPNWSRLGRLKRTVVPQRRFLSKDAFLGRLVCDIKLSSMELIRSRSYDLITLCTNVLKIPEGSITEVLPDDLYKYYESSRDLLELVSLTLQDTAYILRLMFELSVIPLALQITQIAGNVMSRTLMGGRSERNEYLLLHAFTEKDYIVPDKVFGKKGVIEESKAIPETENEGESSHLSKKQVQSRKKPAYSGGLVLEPKKGFYDSLILLMDFNSLYPSIIQEYNICFTTIKTSALQNGEEITEAMLPDSSVEQGILPAQIRRLVESRREVKKLLKVPDLFPEQYIQYNIRQMALKLTANSMYGCLGFTHSRFYAKPLAALVTLKGREILIDTKDIVGKLNYDVIYGDTDSIMINTNCLDYDQVFKIGHEIKREINKKYRQVELDIDGVFKYLLLLKKKKYAAVVISKNKNGELVTTQELKGLDIVRRDWSQLAAEAGKFILNQILSDLSADDRIECIQMHLSKLKDDLHENKIPLSLLIITKQLTKNPVEYADKNGQPHVQVAIRLNSKNGRKYKKGDIVPYVICEDGTNNPATQRAYHIEELKSSDNLKIDVNYYLVSQLHPVISRICDPIDELPPSRIADFLGLDPAVYKKTAKKEYVDDAEVFQFDDEKDKYRQCVEFIFTCVQCKSENVIKESVFKCNGKEVTFLEKCSNTQCSARPIDYLPSILNSLTIQMRKYNAKYYENWLICEDPACTNRTVKLPHAFVGGYPLCNLCEKGVMFREYSEKDLYNQLSYFLYLFTLNKHTTPKSQINPQVVTAFHCLKECVEDALSHSAYSVINLDQLFSVFNIKKKKGPAIKTEPNFDLTLDIEYDDYNMDIENNDYVT